MTAVVHLFYEAKNFAYPDHTYHFSYTSDNYRSWQAINYLAKGSLIKFIFNETCAIMASTRGFGFKNRNFGGFSPKPKIPKIIFGQKQPWLPYNFGSPCLML